MQLYSAELDLLTSESINHGAKQLSKLSRHGHPLLSFLPELDITLQRNWLLLSRELLEVLGRMIEKLLVQEDKKKFPFLQVKEKKNTTCAAPEVLPPRNLKQTMADAHSSFCYESEGNNGRKRKPSSWEQPNTQIGIDLQLSNPRPFDWEQCLDLQSGRMYYLNRKTKEKSWLKHKEQKLDLDLNLSQHSDSESFKDTAVTTGETEKQSSCSNGGGDGGGMVALVCFNCHLLVLLCQSSPSCPNCKYMHLLLPSPLQKNMGAAKSPETLSLLH